jgi:O-antigen ligase
MTLAARGAMGAVILAAFGAAAVLTLVMDRAGVIAGLALPVGIAVAVVVLRRPLLGVQLAVLSVPLEVMALKLGGQAGLSPAELLLLLTAGAALVNWALQGRRPSIPPAFAAVAAICLLIALSYTVATDKVIVTKILLMWSAFAVVGVLVTESTEVEIRRTLICIALAGGIVGAIAVSGAGQQTLVGGGEIATNRAQGSFEQPNVLGFFLVMTIPIAAVLSFRTASLWFRIAMWLSLFFAVWGLMLSLSRTSLLGTALAFGILLLWPPFRRLAVVGLGALLVFSFVNAKALEQSHQVSVLAGRLSTLTERNAVRNDPRSAIYATAPKIIEANPWLGVGEGNFSIGSKPYGLHDEKGDPYDHAHDIVLTFGAELGLAGILLVLWLGFEVAQLAWRAIRTRVDPRLGPLGLGLAAAMAGVLLTNLGDYPPRTNVIAATFLIEVGLLVAIARRTRA